MIVGQCQFLQIVEPLVLVDSPPATAVGIVARTGGLPAAALRQAPVGRNSEFRTLIVLSDQRLTSARRQAKYQNNSSRGLNRRGRLLGCRGRAMSGFRACPSRASPGACSRPLRNGAAAGARDRYSAASAISSATAAEQTRQTRGFPQAVMPCAFQSVSPVICWQRRDRACPCCDGGVPCVSGGAPEGTVRTCGRDRGRWGCSPA